MIYGQRIKHLRNKRGWTQDQLAKRLNVSHSSVASYEINTREPGISMILQLADMFNVSTDYLLGRESFKINDEQNQEIQKIVHEINEISDVIPRFVKVVNKLNEVLK